MSVLLQQLLFKKTMRELLEKFNSRCLFCRYVTQRHCRCCDEIMCAACDVNMRYFCFNCFKVKS